MLKLTTSVVLAAALDVAPTPTRAVPVDPDLSSSDIIQIYGGCGADSRRGSILSAELAGRLARPVLLAQLEGVAPPIEPLLPERPWRRVPNVSIVEHLCD